MHFFDARSPIVFFVFSMGKCTFSMRSTYGQPVKLPSLVLRIVRFNVHTRIPVQYQNCNNSNKLGSQLSLSNLIILIQKEFLRWLSCVNNIPSKKVRTSIHMKMFRTLTTSTECPESLPGSIHGTQCQIARGCTHW